MPRRPGDLRPPQSACIARLLVALALPITALPLALGAQALAASVPAQASGVRLVAEDATGVTLEATYAFPGFDTLRASGATYARLRAGGGAVSAYGVPGAPEVAAMSAVLGIPAGARPTLTILSVESEPLAFPATPYPVPRRVPRPDGMADEHRRGIADTEGHHEREGGEVDGDLVTRHLPGAEPAHHQRDQGEGAELEDVLEADR